MGGTCQSFEGGERDEAACVQRGQVARRKRWMVVAYAERCCATVCVGCKVVQRESEECWGRERVRQRQQRRRTRGDLF